MSEKLPCPNCSENIIYRKTTKLNFMGRFFYFHAKYMIEYHIKSLDGNIIFSVAYSDKFLPDIVEK